MNILFWSGGKDAYLALEFFRKNHPDAEIRLLTTYDETDEIVPHQQIKLKDIKKQAIDLGLELITVPLPSDCLNEVYLGRLGEILGGLNEPVEHLIFGDLYLEDIRQWREKVFGEIGYSCIFPIWKKSIHDLLPVLLLKPVEVKISAVKEEFQPLIRVGEAYDQKFVTQLQHLPQDIDPMGENGEFHTQVIFKDLDQEET
ncbi:MAG TPA: hypothetical protein VFG39_08755 [Balneolaceae bacterium]|nr:hypothetical protein [Balneolaceae bacterium]